MYGVVVVIERFDRARAVRRWIEGLYGFLKLDPVGTRFRKEIYYPT